MAIPRQTPRYDERRNSSRVFPVEPGAGAVAVAASRRWAAENPAHAAWVAEGAPTLTEAEHVERFGEPYITSRRPRPAA